jgi:hypothetical protein
MTCRDLLYIAFREARILKRPGAVSSQNELQDGLIYLNQLVDYWSARGCYAWTSTFTVRTLTAGHQPHLIGPGLLTPDFAATQRPVKILSAALVLASSTPPVDLPITIRDNQWWAGQTVKNIDSTIPTDLYYEPDFPNGSLFFWPVPTGANSVRLEQYVVLQQFATLDDTFVAPQAYQAAISLTLAEELVDVWSTVMPGNLAARALKARDALQSNNFLPQRIASADHGTSSPEHAGGDFNYVTGTMPNK